MASGSSPGAGHAQRPPLDTVQTWFDKDAMERAIRALLTR
jgi:hypothetical protein